MTLSRRFSSSLILCLALGIIAPGCALAADKPKVLFLTHSAGFKHSSLGTAEKVLLDLAKRTKAFEATVMEGYKQNQKEIDLSFLTPDYLNQFDAVMFFTTGELPLDETQKQALLDFIKGGKGFIGAHSATDTYYQWPAYGELIGGYFDGHGPNHEILVLKVEDKKHPATKMLGDTWPIADEFYRYNFKPDNDQKPVAFSRDRVRVLLSVDTQQSNLPPQRGMTRDGDYPLAWCRSYGEGRMFYTALGHREDVWENLTFQAHLLGGIKWALGLEAGDATPLGK